MSEATSWYVSSNIFTWIFVIWFYRSCNKRELSLTFYLALNSSWASRSFLTLPINAGLDGFIYTRIEFIKLSTIDVQPDIQ